MSILNLSLAASGLIIFTAFTRCILKYYIPKRVFNLLWAAVCCKLMLPPSLFLFFGKNMNGMHPKLSGEVMDIIQFPVGIYQVTGAVRQLNFRMLQPIWIAGVICLTTFFIWSYIRCIRMFRVSLPVGDIDGAVRQYQGKLRFRTVRIRISDRIASPLTYGILHPVILIPKGMDYRDRKAIGYILEHELAHIKRWDSLYKMCLAVVLVCHWFNPLVWLMYYMANRDIELACDQKVIQILGTCQRAGYAKLLVEWGAEKRDINLLAPHLMETFMEERIKNIMKTRKLGIAGIVLSFSLVAGAVSVYAATPVQPGSALEQTLTGDVTLGGIFEIYTPEEYEEVIKNIKKYSSAATGLDLTAMEADLARLKADNGRNEFVIYKATFTVNKEVNGGMVSVGFNPTIVMAPELVARETPLTAESYQKDIADVTATLDQAIGDGNLTQLQKETILKKMNDNLSKLNK